MTVASPDSMIQKRIACWKPVKVLRLIGLSPVTVWAEKHRNREFVYVTGYLPLTRQNMALHMRGCTIKNVR